MTLEQWINKFANPKGWRYVRRKGKRERQFGYHFVGMDDNSDYFCRIKADNPTLALNRLRPIREATKRLRQR